jgi:prepilin-type N-terminal cleavage/methylation domain-containing protein
MKNAHCLSRRRNAFTLIELLVVMVLILVLAALGLGYIVFGQDNQHSVNGAQAITGALLNAKQRARRDGLPTGVRILFTSAPVPPYPVPPYPSPPYPPTIQPPPTDSQGKPSFGTQLQLIQQPEDYNAGQLTSINSTPTIIGTVTYPPGTVLGFGPSNVVDFQGGAAYAGEIDESTVQAGDYLVMAGTTAPHLITTVISATSLTVASNISPATAGTPYSIIRAPRRLPSEDIIQMPSNMIIDNSAVPGNTGFNYCKNLPQRTLTDTMGGSQVVSEIVFAPSGAVVGQGTQADKIYLWLRDSNVKLWPQIGQPMAPGAPLILSVQIRTGLIGVYPVAPWPVGSSFSVNDPYAYVRSPRSSGL